MAVKIEITNEQINHDAGWQGLLLDAVRCYRSQVGKSAENALLHLEKAKKIQKVDPQMSLFRCITASEEAASAIIYALQHVGYENSKRLNPKMHDHKAAVWAVIEVMKFSIAERSINFFLETSSSEPPSITVRLPLGQFVTGAPEDFVIVPTPPLGILTGKDGKDGPEIFADPMKKVMDEVGVKTIRAKVEAMANERNLLLYASANALPKPLIDGDFLREHNSRVRTMLTLLIGIMQHEGEQAMVKQAMELVLDSMVRRKK